MSKEDNLFDGLEIMSPEEINSSIDNQGENTTEETTEVGDVEQGLEITNPSGESKEVESDKEIVEPSSESEDEPTSEPTNNKYSALIKDMISEGVLSGPEGEELEELLKDASLDTVKEFIENTANNKFKQTQDNWRKNLDPVKKRFLGIEDAFGETDTAIQMAQRLEYFENLSYDAIKEDENLAKNVYYDSLITRGHSQEEAIEMVEEAVALDKVTEKATKAVPYLKQDAESYVEKSRATREAEMARKQEENEQAFSKLMDAIETKEAFVPGLNLNKVSKDKLKQNITTSVHKDKNGKEYTSLMYKQMRNPSEFEMLINYYDTLGLFNLDKEGKFKPDISKLKNIAKTKAVSELDQVLSQEEERGLGRQTSVGVSKKTESALDLLKAAYGKRNK
jgi:hypothetical protein